MNIVFEHKDFFYHEYKRQHEIMKLVSSMTLSLNHDYKQQQGVGKYADSLLLFHIGEEWKLPPFSKRSYENVATFN